MGVEVLVTFTDTTSNNREGDMVRTIVTAQGIVSMATPLLLGVGHLRLPSQCCETTE